MKEHNLKKIFWNIVALMMLFGISIVINIYLAGSNFILEFDFLLTFIGTVLSIVIVILTFMFSSFEKMQEWISPNNKNSLAVSKFCEFYAEITENCQAIFAVLICVIISILWGDINIPCIRFPDWLSKTDFLSFIRLYCFLIFIVLTCDTFLAFLQIVKLPILKKQNTK